MTGPAFGKIPLRNSKLVFTYKNKEVYKLKPEIYVHVKGYALARVTHLDVEHEFLNNLFPRKGDFLPIKGLRNGFKIVLRNLKAINNINFDRIVVISDDLCGFVKENEVTFAYVAGKRDGFFLGFKKKFIKRLEEIARNKGFSLE